MAYEQEEKKPQDDEEELKEIREYVAQCIDDEDAERAKMRDDMRFCTLDQWPSDIRNARESDIENGPRPCLTIDKCNQYIVQVVNDLRQGKPGINARPQDDQADVETAKILKGIIRNIEDQSSADIAYATGAENAVKVGLGFWRVTTEYVDDESDEQEIRIQPIPNTFSTYLGRHAMPDGSDAERGFVLEAMELEKFKAEYPDAKCSPTDFDGVEKNLIGHWRTEETVTVAEYYCLERVSTKLHYLADGTKMFEDDYEKWPAGIPKQEITGGRPSFKTQLKWYKCTAIEILDQRDLPGKYIPIVEMIGRESWVDGRRIVWGLVRPAKDSLRMYNYFASTITEKFGLGAKTPFIGAKGQFEGLEERWKKANIKNFPYLEYNAIDVNGNAIPAPVRQGPFPMEAALFHQMQVIEHDVQTSLGMFKAATGESESQQSGRAILALQRESDTGTYHFGANQGISIRHTGRIILDLIPHYYDTKRIVRIIGDDGEVQAAELDPDQPQARMEIKNDAGGIRNIYNPGLGKYDIALTVGPSYNTKRMEAQATFVEMAKGAADPASAAILRYLVMRNSDTAGSDEAAKLLKTMLPPQALQALASPQPIPPQVQAQMQQMQQQMGQMKEAGQKLQQENLTLKSGAQAQMAKVQVDAKSKQADAMLQKQKQDQEFMLQQRKQQQEALLATKKAQDEMRIKRLTAAGDLEIEKRKREFEEECRVKDDAAKREEADKVEAKESEKDVPKIMEAMKSLTETFAKALQDNNKALEMLAKEVGKPKKVQLGGIQRSDQGITGASATIQ